MPRTGEHAVPRAGIGGKASGLAGVGVKSGDRRAGGEPRCVPPTLGHRLDHGAIELKAAARAADRVDGDQSCIPRARYPQPAPERDAAAGRVHDPSRLLGSAVVEADRPMTVLPEEVADIRRAVSGAGGRRRGAQIGVEAQTVEAPARPGRITDEIRGQQRIGIPGKEIAADGSVRSAARGRRQLEGAQQGHRSAGQCFADLVATRAQLVGEKNAAPLSRQRQRHDGTRRSRAGDDRVPHRRYPWRTRIARNSRNCSSLDQPARSTRVSGRDGAARRRLTLVASAFRLLAPRSRRTSPPENRDRPAPPGALRRYPWRRIRRSSASSLQVRPRGRWRAAKAHDG